MKNSDSVDAIERFLKRNPADRYFTPLMKELHRDFDGVDDIVANWSLRETRAAAWINGAALWHLRPFSRLTADYIATLDGIVGFAGRGLLIPTGL